MDTLWLGDKYFLESTKITNKTNLLITAGCSWVEGSGTEYMPGPNVSYEFLERRFKHSYPYLLSDALDADLYNLGRSGSSIDYIYDSVIRILPKIEKIRNSYEKIYLQVTFTDPNRFTEIDKDTEYLHHIQPGWPDTYNSSVDLTKYVEYHTMAIYSEIRNDYRSLKMLYTLQTLCKVHNIEFYHAHAFGCSLWNMVMTESFQENFKYLIDGIDFSRSAHHHETRTYTSFQHLLYIKGEEISDNNQIYFAECKHPNIEGYKIIATELARYIKQYEKDNCIY